MNPKAFYQNSELIPCSPLYSHKDNDKEDQCKSDLKLISAMCLQGMLENGDNNDIRYLSNTVSCSILFAKELLKQLETENEN